MVHLRVSEPRDGARIVEIWRSAVDATHDFLSPQDRASIEQQVMTVLPSLPLWLAIDDNGTAAGFMGLSGSHMDSLFIAADQRGRGVGRQLVEHAVSLHSVLTTDVNEQNAQALRFYQRLGFVAVGRSPRDGEGRAYPLIHMKLDAPA
jgi:putative acetyltransferase